MLYNSLHGEQWRHYCSQQIQSWQPFGIGRCFWFLEYPKVLILIEPPWDTSSISKAPSAILFVVICTGFQITLFSLAAKKSATCFSFKKKKKAWIQFYIGNIDSFVKKEGVKTLVYPKWLNICHFRVFCSKVQY